MKRTLYVLCTIAMIGCNGSDVELKENDTESLHNFNLAKAYIDNGMMTEASEKLAILEKLLPDEAFVYANQGLVALRQNELKKATELLAKADALAPNKPSIALLQGQVAMLTGQFEDAKQVLAHAIAVHPKNIQLRWAIAVQLRGHKNQIEHLEVIVNSVGQNIVARLALIKALIADEQLDAALDHMLVLQAQSVIQDEQAMGLFNGAMNQLDAGNSRVARAQVIGLDNVLKPTRAWQHSQLEVAGAPGTIGHPVRTLLNYAIPEWTQPVANLMRFQRDSDSVLPSGHHRVLLVESPTQSELITVSDPTTTLLVPIDWNNDRNLEVVVATTNGRVFIEGGIELLSQNGSPITSLTPWDADQDGDLDLLVSRGETFLLRNNGDQTVTIISLDAPPLTSTSIIDIDEDGAVDVVGIDDKGKLTLLKNERSGRIHVADSPLPNVTMKDLVVGDFNFDGWMDIAWIGEDGAAYIGKNTHANTFIPKKVGGKGHAIAAADIDNDTRLDVLVIGDTIQLFQWNGGISEIDTTGKVQIVDVDLDGDLDIIVNGDEYAIWEQEGTPNENTYQKIILEAILEGGQRNNALGIGGFVEVISGGTYQKHLITGPMTHIGLGGKPADAIRVVWPNGVPQEIIEPKANQVFTEVQILKGSCPFLATSTEDGTWEFVTDLLWRSPLGLKINAQTVPPIATTQDWVKVRSDQMHPRNGIYELGITAQLWETHFIDDIKLVAIDHPIGTEVFVDERFVAPVPPEYQLYLFDQLQIPVGAIDHHGRDVRDTISARDGKRLGGFAKGSYQGIAEDHFIELELGQIDINKTTTILASGWIRPTDTSINVASAQGNSPPPKALEISVPDGRGGWTVIIPNAGFPAGKLKTIVLELPQGCFATNDYRVRIATNLEIYWDQIQYGYQNNDIKHTQTPIVLLCADLGYMGFPTMSRTNKDAPNIPDYNDIQHGNAWRDLEGYYTRYGSVDELVSVVDNRYVIMNAGDAMYLQFKEPTLPIPDGCIRDFVFFCDGWVKDGDWNTVDSRTVEPLPFHTMSGYPYPTEEKPKELLPTHSDWIEYHTRYITPAPFRDALK